MFQFSDRFRLSAKDFEFKTPPEFSRIAYPLFGIKSPFNTRDNELRAIFLHVPKTAGSSIRHAAWGDAAYHIPALRYYNFDQDKFNMYFKFCIVRNPWSRMYSAYNYLKAKAEKKSQFRDHRWAHAYLRSTNGFESFVRALKDKEYCRVVKKYIHFRDQLDWVSIPDNVLKGKPTILPNYIGRYENLTEAIELIRGRLGVRMELPHLRRGAGTDYRSVYNSEMVDIVANIYRRDIETFSYSFET